MAKLSSAIDDFGRLLLSKLEAENAGTSRNLQVSPFGVVTVLSMLSSGSATETLEEICKTLQFDHKKLESDVYAAFDEALKVGNLYLYLTLTSVRYQNRHCNN